MTRTVLVASTSVQFVLEVAEFGNEAPAVPWTVCHAA